MRLQSYNQEPGVLRIGTIILDLILEDLVPISHELDGLFIDLDTAWRLLYRADRLGRRRIQLQYLPVINGRIHSITRFK